MKLLHNQQAYSTGLRFIKITKFNIESGPYDYHFGEFDKEIKNDIRMAITYIKRNI